MIVPTSFSKRWIVPSVRSLLAALLVRFRLDRDLGVILMPLVFAAFSVRMNKKMATGTPPPHDGQAWTTWSPSFLDWPWTPGSTNVVRKCLSDWTSQILGPGPGRRWVCGGYLDGEMIIRIAMTFRQQSAT